MMKRSHVKSFAIFIALSLVLINYQNCSSAANSDDALMFASSTEGTIDEVNTGEIDFIQEKVSVNESDENLTLYGICSSQQNGAMISWKLFDKQGNEMERGQALCDTGAFEVSFEGVDQLACDSKLSLKAFFGAKANSQMSIEKNCN